MNIFRWVGAVILISILHSSNIIYGAANKVGRGDSFVGTWELEFIEIKNPEGEWAPWTAGRFGPDPIGMIIYDSSGNMGVQIMARNRPAADSSEIISGMVVPDELKSLIIGYVAYFGAYEVNEQESYVVHHRRGSLFSKRVGTSAKRLYRFVGDRLILTLPSEERRFIWKRIH